MDNLDDVLNVRKTPKAPSNLAHRIIQAAEEIPAPRRSIKDKLYSYLGPVFTLPRPAYVMAVAVVFALVLGVAGIGPTGTNQSAADDIEYDLVAYVLFDEDEIW